MSHPSFKLQVKVVPGSSRNKIAGWLGDALRTKVAAPPERGKANNAVLAILAEVLEVPRGSIRILSGTSSPQKVLEIDGLSEEDARHKLSDAIG